MPPTPPTPLPTAERVIEDTFLTPRVIDRRAFDDYSAALQELIREAAGRAQSLQSAVAEVKALGDSLREATSALKARLDTAVKVMPTLEQRVARAEQLLAAASGTRLAEHAQKAIEATIAAKTADLERRVAAIVAAAEQRLGALQQAMPDPPAGTPPPDAQVEALVDARIEQAQVRLATAYEQGAALAQSADEDLRRRIGALSDQVAQAQRQSAEKLGALDAALSAQREQILSRIAALEGRAGVDQAAHARASTELDEALRALDERRAQVESRAAEVETHLKARAEEVRERLAAMDRDIQAATAGVRQKARADLEQMLAMVEAAAASVAEKTGAAQEALAAAVRQAREHAVEVEARLERRIDLAHATTESHLAGVQTRSEALAAAGAALEDRINSAVVELERLLVQSRQRAAALARQAEEAGAQAHRTVQDHAAETLRHVGAAVKEAHDSLAPLHQTTRALIGELDDRMARVAWEYQNAVAPHLTRLDKLCEQASRLCGADGAPSVAAAIAELAERAERLRDQARQAVEGFESVRTRAEQARATLADSIAEAGARLDDQQSRLELHQSRLDEQMGISQTVLANTSAAEEKLELLRRSRAALEKSLAQGTPRPPERAQPPAHAPTPAAPPSPGPPESMTDALNRLRGELGR